MRYLSFGVLSALMLSSTAYAETESAELREEISCFPAGEIIEFLGKFDDLPDDRTDTVSAKFAAAFTVTDGGNLPDRFFYRNADAETDFNMTPEGEVADFMTLKSAAKNTEMCVQDKARIGLPNDEDGIDFNLDLDIAFKNTSGVHSVEELRDGGNDGRKHYKKMIGGLMSKMLPKFEYATLSYEDETIGSDTISAFRDGQKLDDLEIEIFEGSFVISIDQLEDMKADEIRISGGAYSLEPTPSIKIMKKFMSEDKKD